MAEPRPGELIVCERCGHRWRHKVGKPCDCLRAEAYKPTGHARAVVECGGCGLAYSYPLEVPRDELLCPDPRCQTHPLTRGGLATAMLDENAPEVSGLPKAVLNDGSRTVV